MNNVANAISELTRRMAAGDAAAIAAFYDEYFAVMYREARFITKGDEATCLDLVQDAMLKLLRSIKSIDTEERLQGWTKRLVRCVAIDRMRSEGRRLRRELSLARPEYQADLESAHDENEARRIWVEELLSQMDAESARMLRMRFLMGWTLKQIGEVLGLKSGAVDGRIQRIVRRLREHAQAIEHD